MLTKKNQIDLGSEICLDEETEELVKAGEEIAIIQGRIVHSKYLIREDGIKYFYATKELP